MKDGGIEDREGGHQGPEAYLLEEKKPLEGGPHPVRQPEQDQAPAVCGSRSEEREYWYAVGDLILVDLKNNKFRLSKDRTEEFDGSVVLRVVEKKSSPALGMDLLELDYEGEGEFKRIFTLLKKKKVSMARPCSLDEQQQAPFSEAEDPREQERALSEKEFQDLRENLLKALEESGDFLFWNGFWIHKSQLVKIKDKDVVKLIRTMEERHALPEPVEGSEAPVVSLLPSLTTEEVRTNQLSWETPPENNEITDFSINYTLPNIPVCVTPTEREVELKESFEASRRKPLFRKLSVSLTPKSETLSAGDPEFIRKSNKRNPDEAVYVPVPSGAPFRGAEAGQELARFMEGRREVSFGTATRAMSPTSTPTKAISWVWRALLLGSSFRRPYILKATAEHIRSRGPNVPREASLRVRRLHGPFPGRGRLTTTTMWTAVLRFSSELGQALREDRGLSGLPSFNRCSAT